MAPPGSAAGPTARVVLTRGLRARCPACGVGRLFDASGRSVRECDACTWRLERCPGHWVGGNEINLLATFPAGIASFAIFGTAFGLGLLPVLLAVAVTAAFSFAFYRSSRGLFFALDYLVDRTPDPALPPQLGDSGEPRDPRRDDPPPPPRGPIRGRGIALPASARHSAPLRSESFIAPAPSPYPPPATVSP